MDNTQFAYLFGAFLLGFLVAWIAGRSGPKRELEECQANGQALQRKLDDRDRAVTKAEGQAAKLQADLTALGADKSSLTAALAAANEQCAAATAGADGLRARVHDTEGEILRLRAELQHASDAWAGARARTVELASQMAAAADLAAVAEESASAAEEAAVAAEAGELTSLAQINDLTAQLDAARRELELTRAAASRTAALALLRPQLTPERREQYAALAGNPDQVVGALHERDIAVADAVNETNYLRRSLGVMTGMSADLATALDKRTREYESVTAKLAAASLVPAMIATRMEEAPAGDGQDAAEAEAEAIAPEDSVAAELQAQFDDLWTRFNATAAANGELEGELQTQRASLADLLARLGGISDELAALGSDEDAPPAEDTAPDAAAAEDAAAPAAVVNRLAAGVALALATVGRKNERMGSIFAEQARLESSLAEQGESMDSLTAQVNALQTDLSDRGVKFDALSLHASSLEADMALAERDRSQLDAQLRQIAAELAALADEYAPAPENSAQDEAAAAVEEAPAAEAAPAAEDADAPMAAAAEPIADAASPTALEQLAAGLARVRAVVAAQQLNLTDAAQRLTTLGEQIDAVNEEENALTATLAEKDAALADAGQQLDTLHSSLAAALGGHEEFQQRIDRYRAELSDLLAQYAEPISETAPVEAETAADESAPADAALEAPDGAGAEVEGAEAEPEPAPADAVAAAIAAIGALVARKQGAIAALNQAQEQLNAALAGKEQALGAANGAYANLEGEFSRRSAQFDALSLRAGSLEADMEIAAMNRARVESQLQAVADKLGAIAAGFAPAEAAPAGEAAAAPAPKPLAAQLEENAAAVIALVESKAAALSAAEQQVAALQQDLTARGDDLAAAGAQAEAQAAQLAAAAAAKAEVESTLAAIGEQVAALQAETGADAAPAAAEAASAAAEAPPEDSRTALLAGISGLGVVLARRRQAIEEGKARIAALEQQTADLAAQLEAAELDREQIKQNLDASGAQIEALTAQVNGLQAQLDAATAEREGLRASIAAIGGDLDALGAAVDADDDEQADEAVNRLVKTGLAAGGATAVVHSVRTKRDALQDANAQIEQLQQQLAAAAATEAELQTRTSAQIADFTATSSQIEEMQAKLAALDAEKASAEETLQRQLEEAQAKLQEQDASLVGMRRQLDYEAEWQRKSPFLAGLVQKLNKWSGFKATAASSALEEQVIPKTVRLPENLTDVTHIGKTYADRLNDADVGTHWELAFVPDADLAKILKLNELQLMGMDFAEVRASARQIAVESGAVGYMWERGEYDDFEPIKGIGKVMERRLYNAGITTYAQLAELTPEQLHEICQPKPPLRPKFDSWIEQAQDLLAAKNAAAAAEAAATAAEPSPPAAE